MSNTLFVEAGNFRAFKILIAAEYNGVQINIPAFTANETNKTPEFLEISPMGKVPAMKTAQGGLFESNAIARYVARMRQDTGLLGATFHESAEVDQWIDFCAHSIELPACIWFYPILGYMEANAAATDRARGDLANALAVLDAHLASRTFLVGEAMTLADITIASTLVYPFKFVCDAAYRASYGNVMRWFETCVNQPQFEAVVGKVVLATSEAGANSGKAIAGTAAKKDKKGGDKPAWDGVKKEKVAKAPKPPAPPKAEKKPKVQEAEDDDMEVDETPKAPKEEHIFKIMDGNPETKSPFNMDAWKRDYSNAEDYNVAIGKFFETADWNGWSLFRGDYNYNEELKVLFMTGNLIGGFIQRTDEIRKWLFGTMSIRGDGEEGNPMQVSCYFFIRGQDIQPLIACNDDAACYTWTKVCGGDKKISAEDQANVTLHWQMDYGDAVEGTKCLDSRVYK